MSVIFAFVAVWFHAQDGKSYVRFTFASPVLLLLSVGLMLLMAMAIGSFTAVLGQGNRDTRWSVGFLLGPWMLVTPILYSVASVPDDLEWTLAVNPATLPCSSRARRSSETAASRDPSSSAVRSAPWWSPPSDSQPPRRPLGTEPATAGTVESQRRIAFCRHRKQRARGPRGATVTVRAHRDDEGLGVGRRFQLAGFPFRWLTTRRAIVPRVRRRGRRESSSSTSRRRRARPSNRSSRSTRRTPHAWPTCSRAAAAGSRSPTTSAWSPRCRRRPRRVLLGPHTVRHRLVHAARVGDVFHHVSPGPGGSGDLPVLRDGWSAYRAKRTPATATGTTTPSVAHPESSG